jgi:hypothetical protein
MILRILKALAAAGRSDRDLGQRDFEVVVKAVRAAIERNQPAAVLDRCVRSSSSTYRSCASRAVSTFCGTSRRTNLFGEYL